MKKYKIINGNYVIDGYTFLKNGVSMTNKKTVTSLEVIIPSTENPVLVSLLSKINKIKNYKKSFDVALENSFKKKLGIKKAIETQELKHSPLAIYSLIPPKNYVCLGDVVETENYNIKQNINKYSCVPEQCVVDARPWLAADKIYEYDNNGTYFALFKNPYLNTFKTVTVKGAIPQGNVQKIVACVSKSRLIENIIHSDKCANEYKTNLQNTISQNSLNRNSQIYREQEDLIKQTISLRENEIAQLQNMINTVNIQDQKANIINHSANRAKFQKLLDTQLYNMDKLIKNLFSLVSVNVNLTDLQKFLTANNVSDITTQDIINTATDLEAEKLEKIQELGTTSTGSLPDAQLNTGDLQRVIYKISDTQEQEMVLRSLVESSCGCYFSDKDIDEYLQRS